jgi:hypothetical protein
MKAANSEEEPVPIKTRVVGSNIFTSILVFMGHCEVDWAI